MPLRDHFRPPLDDHRSWDELHGGWPMVLVTDLNGRLPPRYVAAPRVHVGMEIEVDVAALERPGAVTSGAGAMPGAGGPVAAWTPARPTLAVETTALDQDEYEVRVYDTKRHRRLVAAVEIVSPANKDRPDSRRAFVAKCVSLLQQGVSVALVDLVTTRQSNLYGELLELIGEADPLFGNDPPAIYAAACRARRAHNGNGAANAPAGAPSWRLEAWAHPLEVGRPLPTLPLWLADDLAVPLELEATYEQTCRALRIA